MGTRTGLDAVERRLILLLPGLELGTLRRPNRSQSLCRPCYPDSQIIIIIIIIISVGTPMGYGLDGPGLIPGNARFFSCPQRPNRLWGPPSLLSKGYRGYFPG
jgi:hypothetical protein